MDLTICIATFGSGRWADLAARRAFPSARGQGAEVVMLHGETLHGARNQAIRAAATEWVVCLDADDELAPGYVDAIMAATGDLRAPAVSWVTAHSATDPVTLHDRDIEHLNPCVIGTAIRRELVLDLGGFQPWPAWEDYALFLKAHRAGAALEHVPDAVYRAWIMPGSRNQTVRNPRKLLADIKAAA